MHNRTFDSVLCFGDSDWWYHNRGHADMQYMRRFARSWQVLYVNSLGMRAPAASEGRMFLRRLLRKSCSFARYFRDGGEGFHVLSPLFFPVFEGLVGRVMARTLQVQLQAALRMLRMRRPLIWVACPSAACVYRLLPKAGVVYQLSDYYGGLYSRHSNVAEDMEQMVAREAGLVLCSSTRLHERSRRLYGCGEYLDHGVDFELFQSATRKPKPPRELMSAPHPRIGFFGNLDSNTIDRALLEEVIRLRPEYRFVLVGPMASDFEDLRRLPNVVAIGQQPYSSIPHYGASFDVCLMPWHQNEWIEHCNPIKLKEYLALGKPVVSTPFPELHRYGDLCYVAKDSAQFASLIDRALAEDSPTRQAKRRVWAAQNTWDAKFRQVLQLLEARGIRGEGEICSGANG